MELRELVTAATGRGSLGALDLVGDPAVAVTAITHDSRRVGPGSLYCCVPGAVFDGHDFAEAAVAAGAAALLCERRLAVDVPQLVVPSVRRAMGPLAAAVHGFPSESLELVGITGTNGKTTIAALLASIAAAAGRPSGVIGTLTGARTTPEAPELQELLAEMASAGRELVAMEVSSHALDLHRVDGCRFRVAVFTNLSQDHLDHHGTMEAYFAAKARLFGPELCDLAVLNLDEPHGRLLADAAQVPYIGYSLDQAEHLSLSAEGSRFTWRGAVIDLPLPGRFNVANALAAATAAEALGVPVDAIARGLAGAGVVDGRFERIDNGQPFLAAVDYAHTPEGLRQLLEAARELATGRVIIVFGAGGDRDPGKRPKMGEAAGELADVVVLTTDNPRGEDPAAIISAVQNGMDQPNDLRIEPDRAAAIALAVEESGPGDVLLVAGKGHETTQIIGDVITEFDDREVLRGALVAAGWSGAGEAGS
ncbi:UDP-N-acetylmuramoyl-L-alanyl-D-glutamate--2,6-diaminopimelate ligase [Aquihabitans sp. McL0605]|uniref:UDP-N-acetylmuramoyl-L-alanyl-D-glutamate--2, 6-diaminopimelate ligase n=1 Tax=Aquihabitans sp. McL0605 TaxID=3415671 RepID=UPI003CE8C9E6